MKIRSQVGMVLNLDKCIGCHRKMKNIDWLDGEGNDQVQESVK